MTHYQIADRIAKELQSGKYNSSKKEEIEFEIHCFRQGRANTDCLLYKDEAGIWQFFEFLHWHGFNPSNVSPFKDMEKRLKVLNKE